jgi:hypothetical protein
MRNKALDSSPKFSTPTATPSNTFGRRDQTAQANAAWAEAIFKKDLRFGWRRLVGRCQASPEYFTLVLNVNEKFKPWLIERSRLYDAMNTADGDKKRGLLRIE